MKTALKAALLSGLVFPGLGHIYLKRYGRGIIIMICSLAGFGYIISTATIGALDMLQKMQTQGAVDTDAISRLAVSAAASTSLYYNAALVILACCWLFSVVDAYRIGKGRNSPDRAIGKS